MIIVFVSVLPTMGTFLSNYIACFPKPNTVLVSDLVFITIYLFPSKRLADNYDIVKMLLVFFFLSSPKQNEFFLNR